jgi:hypothetical protein
MGESLLTAMLMRLYTQCMAQSFIVFDFGSNEEAAQQARLTLERWKQSFRLDKKLLLKFDRNEPGAAQEDAADRKDAKHADSSGDGEAAKIIMLVRLDFSDHERLSHQRWLDRIPAEASFQGAQPKVIRHGDAEFDTTTKRFDSLD